MILADKIIRLRKKNGWTQEELAEKMSVSRQAVSKWEGAQTIPDIEKILLLSKLFGVTTDYLLKDNMEDEEFTDDTASTIRRVTLSEANQFLDQRKNASIKIAFATFLCILSAVPLLILSAAVETTSFGMSENMAVCIGLSALLLIVAIAVAIYIHCSFKNAPYEFLEKEPFETEYGVEGIVKERQRAYKPTYTKYNIIATALCVLSPIALFIGAFTRDEFFTVIMLTVTMLIVGLGVALFIIAGVRWSAMQRLLKEGEFAITEKKTNKIKETLYLVYWLIVTAVFLVWSFAANNLSSSWIVWPIAGLLFTIVMSVCNLLINKND